MKTTMTLLMLAAGLTLTACGDQAASDNNEGQASTHSGEHSDHSDGTQATDNSAAKGVVVAYLKVKDALVETDAEETASAAKALVVAVGDDSSAHMQQIKKYAESIVALKEVEEQRAQFELLSKEVYELASSADLGMTLYKQYCPMAFDNQGAFWLSSEEEILNPYFGDMMLHCGKVQEEI